MLSLDRATLTRLEADSGPILIALSGGGDSVALLHALRDHFPAARLRACVIDHALRDGSAADAARAAGFAGALGVAAEVRTVAWAEPGAKSQQAARRKRYVALSGAAREAGARYIAVAHTADDQAETVFMRAGAGSGWRGLAGMNAISAAPVWPEGRGLFLARPMLNLRRAELRAALSAQGAAWLEDPANSNPRFERVRVRARLAQMEAAGFDPMHLLVLAARACALAGAIDDEAAALIAASATFANDWIRIAADAWRGSQQVRERALAATLLAAGGGEREAPHAALARLTERLTQPNFHGATLGGARVVRTRAGFAVTRDSGAVTGRADGAQGIGGLDLPAGVEKVWDGRLAIVASAPARLDVDARAMPVITGAGAAMPLAAAIETGLVDARWLTEQHLIHRLGPLSTTKIG